MEPAPNHMHLPAKLLRLLSGAIYPLRCAICRGTGFNGMDICESCYHELPWITSACARCALPLAHDASCRALCGHCQQKPPRFDAGLSLFRYETGAMLLVQQLKFNQRLAVSRLLGEMLLARLVQRQAVMPDCILPVPLHRGRLRQRGFNQSIELARPLAKALAVPMDVNSVIRARDTHPQTGLDRDSRRKNMRNAFDVESSLRYRHVAILDDVVTTGSTVNELARLLKSAGVKRVDVWSIARAV